VVIKKMTYSDGTDIFVSKKLSTVNFNLMTQHANWLFLKFSFNFLSF